MKKYDKLTSIKGGGAMAVDKKKNEKVKEYIKNNYHWINIMFKNKDEKDMELLDWMNRVHPSETGTRSRKNGESGENRSEYIKRLLREDMERHSGAGG